MQIQTSFNMGERKKKLKSNFHSSVPVCQFSLNSEQNPNRTMNASHGVFSRVQSFAFEIQPENQNTTFSFK